MVKRLDDKEKGNVATAAAAALSAAAVKAKVGFYCSISLNFLFFRFLNQVELVIRMVNID
jgi:hypothetical protein